jgi:hypothetical protein
MPREPRPITRRRLQLFFGIALAAIFYFQYQWGDDADVVITPRAPVVHAAETVGDDPFERLIRQAPLAALIEARARHQREVTNYECIMVKQELLPSGMSEEQEIKVKFRQEPYSVFMDWIRNPGLANRALYVKGRWTDPKAKDPNERELAVAQPGKIAQLFVKSVKQPIRGKLAHRSSRRSMDDFGFQKTLDLLIKYCHLAKERGELSLEFCGESRFDGRPVWVIRRRLPYTGPKGEYPDRTAEFLIDKQHRVPVAVYCYSDDEKQPQNLLGKYEYRSVRMGAGLTDRDFEPSTYGM